MHYLIIITPNRRWGYEAGSWPQEWKKEEDARRHVVGYTSRMGQADREIEC